MRIVVHGGEAASLILFRCDLMRELRGAGHDITAVAPAIPQAIVEQLAAIGVKTVSTRLARTSIDPFGDLRSLVHLVRQLRAVRPHLILSYTIKPIIYGTIGAWIVGVHRRAALVTGRGYAFSEQASRLVKLLTRILYRFALGRAHIVIFQNPDDQRYFVETDLVEPKKCHLVSGSGVNLQHFRHAPQPEQLSFLLAARLLRAKGIPDYIEAARIVKRRCPNIAFQLLGPRDPSPDRVPDDLIESAIAEGVIVYHGETKDVRPYLEMCSVFVLPSYYGEGVPRSVLEALAMGRPAIVSDSPGCRETVVDGSTGILVPARDPAKLATAMLRFVNDPSLATRMGDAAHKFVSERFDVHLVNRQMLAALGLCGDALPQKQLDM
jgi:glycosyltransferase involved in cell wall biosynthesis